MSFFATKLDEFDQAALGCDENGLDEEGYSVLAEEEVDKQNIPYFYSGRDNTKLFRIMEKCQTDRELDDMAGQATSGNRGKRECLNQFFKWGRKQYHNGVEECGTL